MVLNKTGKYIEESREIKRWKLTSFNHEKIDKVVVIPALAEKDYLFKTLLSLSKNQKRDLNSTVILCVVNNRPEGFATPEEIKNNEITLKYLNYLISGSSLDIGVDPSVADQVEEISHSGLKLAYVDASSDGSELPGHGGVGLARKIGMDHALTLFENHGNSNNLIISLDADTTVQPGYLSEIDRFFSKNSCKSAVISYSHQLPDDEKLSLSICAYELFLRYYTAGLKYAESPYAFHTIGSTMVCASVAYVAVGGMCRKRAAEDFYFLQNLAKYSPVGEINSTTVFPSSRVSGRVPFGTGRKMKELSSTGAEDLPFYNPEIFAVLKKYLMIFSEKESLFRLSGDDIMTRSRKIDPSLYDFLMLNDFKNVWEKLKFNSSDENSLSRHFNVWFDAFKTMKLIRYLTDNRHNYVDMYRAVETLSEMSGTTGSEITAISSDSSGDGLKRRLSLLKIMQTSLK